MIRSIKKFLAVALLPALLLAASPASAAPSEARVELENAINKVLAELSKPELKNPATRDAVLNRVEAIINTMFSFDQLSMRTVGPKWKEFTPDQKKRFTEAFEDLLRERYLKNLDGYNGETVSYLSEVSSTKGDKVEIKTSVNIKGKAVPVDYRMLKTGKWVVYDVVIEGVSMVQNYRSQFQSVLAKGDAESLINQVRAKAEEARVENKR